MYALAEYRGEAFVGGTFDGILALLAHPEEVLRDKAGERLAILLLSDRAELLAERLEARIGHGRGRGDRHRLVGLGRSGGRLLRRRSRSTLRRRGALAAGRRQLPGPRQWTLRKGRGGEQQRGDGHGGNETGLHRYLLR
jgi:hypothetical protein